MEENNMDDITQLVKNFTSLVNRCNLSMKRSMLCTLYNSIKEDEQSAKNTIPHGKSIEDFTQYIPDFVNHDKDEVLLEGIKADIEKMNFNRNSGDKVQTRWFGKSFRKNPKEYPHDQNEIVECTPLSEVPFVEELINKVNDDVRSGPGKVALVTYYPKQVSSLSAHADDELYLDQSAPISTFSIGSTRKIDLLKRTESGDLILMKTQTMEEGSLFVMKSGCQKYFLHRVNKGHIQGQGENGERFSISVRSISEEYILSNDGDSSINTSDISGDLFAETKTPPPRRKEGTTTLILGDSIDRDLVPTRLQKGRNSCINLSKGGYKIKNISDTIDEFANTHGDIVINQVILSIGINDIMYCQGRVQHLKDAYISLVHKLKLLFPDVKIFIRSVLPIKIVNQNTVQNLLKFNKLLFHICKTERCFFVDLFSTFLDNRGQFRNMALYKDNIHLKQRGISILARKYIFIINKNTFNPIIS